MKSSSLWKEPLVHFLMIGMLLFALHSFFNKSNETDDQYILIDDDDIARLITQYKQVWNEEPSEQTIQKLVEEYVDSEILYKEALAMNLDHNDEIIKRRLKQKYEFLVKDLATLDEPSDHDLKEYFEQHRSTFSSDRLISFTQYYFSPDKRTNPIEDAQSFFENRLKQPTGNLGNSDASHLKRTYNNISKSQARSTFGQLFSEQLFSLDTLGWAGPVESGYGTHVLHLKAITQDSLKPFEDVKENVVVHYNQQKIIEYNKSLREELWKNYKVDYQFEKWKSIAK